MTQPAGPSYTITTTQEQDDALKWVAGDPPNSAQAYLQARNDEMLNSYVAQHNLASAPVPTRDVAVAYAYATPEQQAAVVTTLGLDQPQARETVAARSQGIGIAL